jgi:CheY-like chemotaxis protein
VKLYFKTSDVPEIELPIDKGEPDAAPKKTARILIAEDQEAVIGLLVRILRNEGHEVVPALTGDQALQIFQSDNSFDLLVTDIVMPGQLQGPELARQLRRLNPALPVVFMSGYAWEATIHGIGLRQTDIRLMKPVSKKDLVNSVQSALASLRRE